jgi:hypothetical protein
MPGDLDGDRAAHREPHQRDRAGASLGDRIERRRGVLDARAQVAPAADAVAQLDDPELRVPRREPVGEPLERRVPDARDGRGDAAAEAQDDPAVARTPRAGGGAARELELDRGVGQ